MRLASQDSAPAVARAINGWRKRPFSQHKIAFAAARAIASRLIYDRNRQLRSTARKRFFELARPFTPSFAVERDGAWYFIFTADEYLGYETFLHGHDDIEMMSKAIVLLREYGYELRDRWFIDVGANIGTSTITALKRFGAREALAIEPGPANYRLLRCNLVANDLEDRARTVRAAVSAEAGSALLELSPWNFGAHELRLSGSLGGVAVPVPVARLDDLVAEHVDDASAVGLLWVDVQAHEPQVLAGAPTLLAKGVPAVIEYWPGKLRHNGTLDTLHALIAEHYRVVFDLRTDSGALGAEEVSRLADRYPDPAYSDLLLIP